mmetsp:Transcript_4744/g.8113  ORF Transcript_4744/g.8113 Transcript_4744/m.8113 type:complete len:203 (+) Transcript_4744:286-894(+)
MGSEAVEQGPDLRLGSQVALPVILLGHLEPHLHPLKDLLVVLLGPGLLQLGELLLASLVELHPLTDVEGVGPEEPADLLLQLGHVLLVEGWLEDLAGEYHHGLVEVAVGLLVGEDARLELHEAVDVAVVLGADRLVREDDPAVLVRHLLRLLVQLLLLRGQHLGDGQASLLGLLLQHLLLVFQSEELAMVVQHRLQQLFVLG